MPEPESARDVVEQHLISQMNQAKATAEGYKQSADEAHEEWVRSTEQYEFHTKRAAHYSLLLAVLTTEEDKPEVCLVCGERVTKGVDCQTCGSQADPPNGSAPLTCDGCGTVIASGGRYFYHYRLDAVVHPDCYHGVKVKGEDISSHAIVERVAP